MSTTTTTTTTTTTMLCLGFACIDFVVSSVGLSRVYDTNINDDMIYYFLKVQDKHHNLLSNFDIDTCNLNDPCRTEADSRPSCASPNAGKSRGPRWT